MKTNRKRSFQYDQSSKVTEGSESVARLPSDYSHPTLQVKDVSKFQLLYSTDVNLTIRLRVSEFTRRDATVLCGQALYEVAHYGLSISDWVVLEWFYSYLMGNKREPFERKDLKELELLLLLKVVLLSGTWMGLEEKRELPQDIQLLILGSRWVPNKRTYHSRQQHFEMKKFLEVRIVPVSSLIEREKGTTRYSSYCKGYGESSRMGRRQRTRPSAETDGEPVILETEFAKIPLTEIDRFFELVLADIRYSSKRRSK